MNKQTKKKEPLLCYFHFMFNVWNQAQAKIVFAKASCGWQYLWAKWCKFCEEYGMNAAITMFYVEGLDNNLQKMLADAADRYYNGKADYV